MTKGEYIGGIQDLRGKTALLEVKPNSMVMAQFDDLELGFFSHGWNAFDASDFKITGDSGKLVIVMTKPKEYEPDTVAPELMNKRLREW